MLVSSSGHAVETNPHKKLFKPSYLENPCTETQRTIKDYQDILRYMKRWAIAHKSGEQSLIGIRRTVDDRLLKAKQHLKESSK